MFVIGFVQICLVFFNFNKHMQFFHSCKKNLRGQKISPAAIVYPSIKKTFMIHYYVKIQMINIR